MTIAQAADSRGHPVGMSLLTEHTTLWGRRCFLALALAVPGAEGAEGRARSSS